MLKGHLRLSARLLIILLFCCCFIKDHAAEPLQGAGKTEDIDGATANFADDSDSTLTKVNFVDPKPPAFLVAKRRESITIACEAGSVGGPAPVITWLKNGKPMRRGKSGDIDRITTNTVIASITRSLLYLDCLSNSDMAVYTCVADNTFSRVTTDTELVFLPGQMERYTAKNCTLAKRSGRGKPARIVMWSRTTLQLQGQTVTLFCRASGIPAPIVTWQFHYEHHKMLGQVRTVIDDDRHTVLPSGDLRIKNLEFIENMGNYVCLAENENGFDKTDSFLYPAAPES